MTSQDKANPELSPVENINIDSLLTQVGEMSSRVENLIASNKLGDKSSPASGSSDNMVSDTVSDTETPPAAEISEKEKSPAESELDQVDDLKRLDELTEDKAQTIKENWEQSESQESQPDETETAESSSPEHEPEAGKEIVIDEHVDSLAENEINQMLNRLGKPSDDFPDKTDETTDEDQIPVSEIFPPAVCKLLSVLYVVNYPFIWIPASARECLGYIGIGILLFALGLWAVAGIFYKSS